MNLEAFFMRRLSMLALLALVAVMLGLTACGIAKQLTTPAGRDIQTQKVPVEGTGSYTNVNAASLKLMLENKDFPLVNVHIPYEGEIEPTDLFIPYNEVETNLAKLPADKGAKIVLYCRSGSMSAIAARTLVRLGYTNVWNLDGGMIGWQQMGYPLAQKGR